MKNEGVTLCFLILYIFQQFLCINRFLFLPLAAQLLTVFCLLKTELYTMIQFVFIVYNYTIKVNKKTGLLLNFYNIYNK